ncbi:MAG TPA: hypothetical protein DHW11_06090 [Gemmatimonadetes bacterium]|nr:hypothetical protein [Gemmatimonadota bacterium]
MIVMAMSSLGSPTSAQVTINEATRSPDETATLFLRSVRAIRWGTVAQFLDAEALERFQFTVTMIANADSSGELREYLVQSDSTGMSDLSAFEVFERSINAVIDDMPGLMHALYDRDDSVIGSVREEGGVAHTVYRTLARISGAVPEVKVMQLRSTPEGWRVAWSDELEVIEAALRGVGR